MPAQLDAEEAAAQDLRRMGAISAGFHDRYLRLVKVSRTLVAPNPDASARDAAQAEIDAFVRSVKGDDSRLPSGGGLASIAPVLVDEVVNLHMMLDGSTDREKTRARYVQEPVP